MMKREMGSPRSRKNRPDRRRDVAIIGGGVIGLSVALELRDAGFEVTVFRDEPVERSVSALAGAVWFPFEATTPAREREWALRSLPRFRGFADFADSGVVIREGLVVIRTAQIPEWVDWVPGLRRAHPDELPSGALGGFVVDLPLIEMPIYLRWLQGRCEGQGVGFVDAHVEAIDELADGFDLVVLAAGLSSPLIMEDSVGTYPIRGQVVRVANPGLPRWYVDVDNPAGMTYVFPRSSDVVCGGTAVLSSETDVNPSTEAGILERAMELVPDLVGMPVLSRAVGLRPGRAEVRLESVPKVKVPTIACYGHGGGGVTTSWGCAEDVAHLASRVSP